MPGRRAGSAPAPPPRPLPIAQPARRREADALEAFGKQGGRVAGDDHGGQALGHGLFYAEKSPGCTRAAHAIIPNIRHRACHMHAAYNWFLRLLFPYVLLRLLWRGLRNPDYWRRIPERLGSLPPLPTPRVFW